MNQKSFLEFSNVDSLIQLIESIFSDMNIGLLIYHLENAEDANSMKLIYANKEASKYTGADLNERVGKYLHDAFPSLKKTELPKVFYEVILKKQSQRIGTVEYSDASMEHASYAVKAFPMPNHCVGVIFENLAVRKQVDQLIKKQTRSLQERVDALESFIADQLGQTLEQLHSAGEELRGRAETELSEKDQKTLNRFLSSTQALKDAVQEILSS